MRDLSKVMTTDEASNRAYDIAQERMALLPNYYRWIVSHFREDVTGTVVELGAGSGNLIREYLDRCGLVYAVDFNSELLKRVSAAFPRDRVRPVCADLREDWSSWADRGVDTVIALDVLEHLPEEKAFLERCRGLLRPGGKLIVKVPAQSALFGPMDAASGHYRRYDPEGLSSLMTGHGFQVVRQGFMNRIGALVYRRRRRRATNFSRSVSPCTLRCANACMPLIAAVDRVLPGPGLSLVGVYRL